jgi:hypothetical protein
MMSAFTPKARIPGLLGLPATGTLDGSDLAIADVTVAFDDALLGGYHGMDFSAAASYLDRALSGQSMGPTIFAGTRFIRRY